MEYSEFIRSVKELGFGIFDYGHLLAVEGDNRDNILFVDKKMECVMNTHLADFKRVPKDVRESLFNLALELSTTPLKEREGENWGTRHVKVNTIYT